MKNKEELRLKYKTLRSQLTTEEITLKNEQLVEQFQKIDLTKVQTIHLFLPIKKNREPNTWLILDYLEQLNKKIIVSKTNFKTKQMEHFLYESKAQIQENKKEIPEPIYGNQILTTEIDLVLVPLFCCDSLGNRVGYGGGFYDRFLSQCHSKCEFIGLGYYPIEKQFIIINSLDIPLNTYVNCEEVTSFKTVK